MCSVMFNVVTNGHDAYMGNVQTRYQRCLTSPLPVMMFIVIVKKLCPVTMWGAASLPTMLIVVTDGNDV